MRVIWCARRGYTYLQAIADEARIETRKRKSGRTGAFRSSNGPGQRGHFASHRRSARQVELQTGSSS